MVVGDDLAAQSPKTKKVKFADGRKKTSASTKSKFANTLDETPKTSQSSKLHSALRKRSAGLDSNEDSARAEKRQATKGLQRSKTGNGNGEIPTSISKPKKNSKTQMASKEKSADDPSDDGELVVADQAAALLAGFETESSSSDIEEGLPLDELPPAPAISKPSKKKTSKGQQGSDEGPGTLYIGRIPHGFYEPQMREYFSQFGTVTRLRLAKNKKTGRSKHYAFVEFESAEVTDIVARTMDKYLLFGHILQVRVVPQEQVHPNLWKNAGKRFKVIPRAKIQAAGLRHPQERKTWERRVQREEKRRLEKAEKLKELGYDFDMPKLKQVQDVPMRQTEAGGNKSEGGAMTDKADDNAIKAIEATPAAEKTVLSTLLNKSQSASRAKRAGSNK